MYVWEQGIQDRNNVHRNTEIKICGNLVKLIPAVFVTLAIIEEKSLIVTSFLRGAPP